MLIEDAPLGLHEYLMREEIPLSVIFRAIAELLRTRRDAVIFGAHAVNAYVETERMTEDVDLLSTDATKLAEDLRASLAERFHIALRVREVVPRDGFRVYQLRTPKNRHLIDVRRVDVLPPFEIHEGLQIVAPVELIAMKVTALAARRSRPKGGTDLADVRRLLLQFPSLRSSPQVRARLIGLGSDPTVLALWDEVSEMEIEPDDVDDWG